jgi:hypothetical protein
MAERQLRSRGIVAEGEIITNNTEYEQSDRDIDCNASEIEEHTSQKDQQSPNNQATNSEKSDGNFAMFARQLRKFMESVKAGFEDLQTKIHNDNSRLIEQMENNVKLSETLTNKFKDENEKLRAELSTKLTGEVTQFQKDLEKLWSDTTIELLSVSNSMEGACDKLNVQLTSHIKEAERHKSRVNEELNAKTKVLETKLSQVVENMSSEIQSIRQEFMQAKQLNADVSVKIAECKGQNTR